MRPAARRSAAARVGAALAGLGITGALLAVVAGCSVNDDHVLNIEPSNVEVSTDTATNIVFTATNGVPPYTWSIDNLLWGTLSSSGNVAIFTTVASNGQNSVQVQDGDGNIARAFVIGLP